MGKWCGLRLVVGLAPIVALITCVSGCGDDGAGRTRDGGGPAADTGPGGDDAGVGDAGRDAGSLDRDAAMPREDGAVAGLVCEECTADGDCASGYPCVELPTGAHVCLRPCDRDLPDCPTRFDCVESLITPLPLPVCAPIGERCCVDGDGDDHGVGVGCRGLDCDDTNDTVHDDAIELCDGVDQDCDGLIDEGDPGAGMVCSTGMTGACSSGVTACTGGSIVCVPDAASMAETCDGTDQDCDGNVDEDDMGRALTRTCYDGPAGTEGVGGCMAGVQTCAGGEYRGCVGQILPGTEDCDGVDDDCDGVADDGNPGGGFDCANAAPGVCAQGRTGCVGGSVQCVPTVTPGSLAEICDALDNDCDGTIDDGFPGLGTACFSGLGICRRAGVTICNASDRSAPPICDAAAGTPNPAETCDYVDDDCDGTTDEGFRNASGVYSTVAHCSACGFDCNLSWPGGPASYHVVPSCNVAGSSATCGFTCAAGYVDADGVRDNGCELLPEADTIYVSTPANGGADVSGCGAWDSPCASIGGGIARATATGRVRVRVSTGLYRENVTLVSGISVLGGHSHINWLRNPAVFATTIRGLDVASPAGGASDRIVVTAIGITAATELSGFTISGVNAAAGGNSIGVYVRDSDNDLLVQDNDIAAGAGGNGATGGAGTPGVTGANGAAGSAPQRRACGGAATAGPTGGARTCGATAVNGGAGGAGTNPVTTAASPTRSGAGVTGSTARGGAGGSAGFHMDGTTGGGGTQCTVYSNPIEGAPGVTGTSGPDGTGGAGAPSGTGAITANQWRGTAGASGVTGQSGGGGGGGGSPGGVDASPYGYCLYPATGGSGGSGGCGGTAGTGGSAGGASFAIFIVHTTAPITGTMPRVLSNRLRRGNGGRGGDGGTGGGGGEGGLGGDGGPNALSGGATDTFSFCLFAGAPGGAGGRGGHGGGGGGGAGGASYDVWVSRPGTATPDLSTNTFEIAAGVDTSGTGGVGGNSSNTSIGIGTPGAAGAFGTTRVGT